MLVALYYFHDFTSEFAYASVQDVRMKLERHLYQILNMFQFELDWRPRSSSIRCCYLAHFLSPSSKNKSISKKTSYIFEKWNFLAWILSNILYFLKKKSFSYISGNGTFLYFRKWKPWKNSSYFRKRNCLVFQEVTVWAQKMFLILREMELYRQKHTKLLLIQEGTCRT